MSSLDTLHIPEHAHKLEGELKEKRRQTEGGGKREGGRNEAS